MDESKRSEFRNTLEAFQAVRESLADPNGVISWERGGNRFTLLEMAASYPNLEIVRLLLGQGADPKIGKPLVNAIVRWDRSMSEDDLFAIVSQLLDHGAEVNRQDEDGISALMGAASLPFASITRLLLEHGADHTLLDQYGNNALGIACSRFCCPTVTLLRRAGATMPPDLEFQTSDLHLSAVEGDVAECERLIREGADVNSHDGDGLTPLHCAAHAGHMPVLSFLLEEGAEIDRRCDAFEGDNRLPNLGETALEHAIKGNWLNAVHFLLDAGADVSGRSYDGTSQGCSVLAFAAREGAWNRDSSILRLLLERGIRDDLRAALGQAACWGFNDGVRLLLEYGPSANRDDLLFAMKRTTEENGLGVFPILYEAGQILDTPLRLSSILDYMNAEAGEWDFYVRRELRQAGIDPDETG